MVQASANAPEKAEDADSEYDEEEEEIVYNTEDFISKAYISPNCSMDERFFNFIYSFGFESIKRYNICLGDDDHVIHWSGAIMHIVNMVTGDIKFRRCNDSGYGHIVRHPTLPYLAVGEKGNYPFIFIYEWPDFKVIQVMKRGTKVAYNFLDFSPDGELLASQGGAPDHTLTLWHWAKGWVLLRCKAHTQDVYRTEFSRHFPGRLISSGSGHIKFWTVADTFTGLKLQGKLGKFGKTPISDTTCFYGLSDGLILSAAENGNMLIWEYCQIKTEVIRGKSDPCHNGIINFFEYDNESGDLFTLGSEGKMRCWEFGSILKGKAKGDRKYVSGLASYEVDIKDVFGLANTQFVIKMSNDPESPLFYHYIAQDSKGSVWKLNLELKGNPVPPTRLFLTHKGPVVGAGSSPGDYYVATLGAGGKLLVRNMKTNRLIAARQYGPNGSAMLWLPGTMVCVLGFTDGTLRLAVLSIRQADAKAKLDREYGSKYISCIQALKPHSSRISCFSLREDSEFLASGSDDSTIFIYRVTPYRDYVKLVPIGIMTGTGPVYSLSWKVYTDSTIIACCTNGTALEATFEGLLEAKGSEKYLNPVEVRQTVFKSVKSEILREAIIKSMATRKAEKLAKKRANLAKMKEDNPGLIIDEAVYFQDSDEEEELPALYYPAKACTIFFAKYMDGSYWLSPSGYDAGFFYLYNLGADTPSDCIPIAEAGNIEITTCAEIPGGSYIFLGLGNGKIRVVKVHSFQPFDFSDYMEMTMHDCQYGRITNIFFSHDLRFVYSCGTDSNLFAYSLALREDEYLSRRHLPPLMPIPDYAIDGKIPDDQPSLQEINATAKLRDLEGEAAEMMELKIKELQSMGEKLCELWQLNDLLPADKRLTVTDMELHPKFTRFLKQEFEEKLSIWEKKLQFDYEKAKILYRKVYNYYMRPIKTLDVMVRCFKKKGTVKTYRLKQVSSQFAEAEKFVANFLVKRKTDNRGSNDIPSAPKVVNDKKKVVEKLPGLDSNLGKYVPLLSPQEYILYDAYEKRRSERSDLLVEIEGGRPDLPKETSLDNPSSLAKQGRKLKTDPAFKLPFSKRITKQLKLAHIIRTYKEVWGEKDAFNQKVINLREMKTKEMSRFRQNAALHRKILEFIPQDEALELPLIPPIDLKSEYPEMYYKAESEEMVETKEEFHNLEFDVMDPQVIHYYTQRQTRTADLEEYYAINIYPGIIRLKKLQEKMIYETNAFMENFDQKVTDLTREKMNNNFRLNQLELYLGTLLQEMFIISRYQFLEESTQKAMRSYLGIKTIYTFKVFVRKKRIIRKENNIEAYNEKIKDIVTEFQNMVAGSKFAKHLTRIFKKKFRPPKKSDEEESESESSSSEDESSSEKDEEEGEEMAAYKFDETICPDGCDPYTFNRLFKLRQSRHEYEAKVLNCKKEIAANQHDMVGMRRILKVDGVLLAIYQLQLDRISREKQDELNQVNVLLILDASQVQNWQVEKKKYVHPKDLVVASVKAIRELRESKRQLCITTGALRSQSKQHDLHKMHLKKDITKFDDIHKHLLADRKETLIQKFGIETNVYALDVEATRRLLLSKAYDVVLDERFGLLKQLKDRMYDEKEKLAALKKMHANNLFTLAAIESEKYKAIKYEQKLKTKHLHEYISDEQLDLDLKNLELIICQQKALKERLKNEIRFLKFKDQGPVAKVTLKETVSGMTSVVSVVPSAVSDTVGTEATSEGKLEDQLGEEEVEGEEELMEAVESVEAEEEPSVIIEPPVEEDRSSLVDREVLKFEDIFSRILKQVIPSDMLIEDIDEDETKAELEETEEVADEEQIEHVEETRETAENEEYREEDGRVDEEVKESAEDEKHGEEDGTADEEMKVETEDEEHPEEKINTISEHTEEMIDSTQQEEDEARTDMHHSDEDEKQTEMTVEDDADHQEPVEDDADHQEPVEDDEKEKEQDAQSETEMTEVPRSESSEP